MYCVFSVQVVALVSEVSIYMYCVLEGYCVSPHCVFSVQVLALVSEVSI